MYFFIRFLIAELSGCTITSKGFQSSTVNVRNVDLDPVKADIKVNENSKLTGLSKSIYFLIFIIQGDNTFADGINYSADDGGGIMSKFNPFKIYKTLKLNGVRSSAASKSIYRIVIGLLHPCQIHKMYIAF